MPQMNSTSPVWRGVNSMATGSLSGSSRRTFSAGLRPPYRSLVAGAHEREPRRRASPQFHAVRLVAVTSDRYFRGLHARWWLSFARVPRLRTGRCRARSRLPQTEALAFRAHEEAALGHDDVAGLHASQGFNLIASGPAEPHFALDEPPRDLRVHEIDHPPVRTGLHGASRQSSIRQRREIANILSTHRTAQARTGVTGRRPRLLGVGGSRSTPARGAGLERVRDTSERA
jgi:hypothetical protein